MENSIESLQQLVNSLAKLPNMGQRSARRIALHLLENRSVLDNIIVTLQDAAREIRNCEVCGNIDSRSPCSICSSSDRDQSAVCIVENISNLWAMERSQVFRGKYHVLGGMLSAFHEITPNKLGMRKLLSRIQEDGVTEIILGISATLDGQTTSYYITDSIIAKYPHVIISRLAFGIPIGAELEYMDEGTLGIALKLRQGI